MNATFLHGWSDRGSLPNGLRRSSLFGLLAVPAVYLFYKQDYGVLTTLIIVSAFLILNRASKSLAILGILTFLVTLGDIRRVATLLTGDRVLDPLLLVGPACAIYFATPLLLHVRLKDALSKAVLAVMAVMVLQIFNPRQGSLLVGVSGALFSLIPICWFWIGRRYASDRVLFLLFFRVLVILGVLGAMLAIYQTYIGFFPWEETWAKNQGNYQLTHEGNLRPFGFSNSAAEYGTLMLITAVVLVGASAGKRLVYLLALPIVGTAMVLSAQRGPLIKVIFAGAMMWALRGQNSKAWVPRLVFGLILGIGLLSYSATRAAGGGEVSTRHSRSTADVASSRVSQGLAHPFDQKYSTGGLHLQIFLEAIREGFTNPAGSGLGANSLGARKFSGDENIAGSSEVDISDAFFTLGFIGGFLYLYVIFCAFRAIPDFVQSGPTITRLTAVGLLAALLGGWIALGQYGTGPLAWFCVGALARNTDARKRQSTSIVHLEVPEQRQNLRSRAGKRSAALPTAERHSSQD